MRTVVGVLRGGPSGDYETSLKTGAAVLEHIHKEKYEPRDIFISRSGEWHLHGVAMPPERALKGVDVAYNALHGHYGEDGQVQRLLERLQVPYTGPRPLSAAVAYHKQRTREAAAALGIKVPHGRVVTAPPEGDISALARELFRTFPHPAVVKPVVGGFSRGVTVADTYHALEYALERAFQHAEQVLVEERIPGIEASVGVIDQFRGEHPYALIPDSAHPLSYQQKAELAELAKRVHTGLGLHHYSLSGFIAGKRGIHFIEVDTLPGLDVKSGLVGALQAVGSNLTHFLDHVLQLAHLKK